MALVDQIHALATKCAQMDKDLDTRLSNINVDTLDKPYTDYKPSLSDIDIAQLQDGAIVVTDDPISDSSNAVLAEVEQSLSSGRNTVPSSYAVKEAIKQFGSSRNVGELVYSLIQLEDAGLHLLDGSLLSANGVYKEGIAKIVGLKNTVTANSNVTKIGNVVDNDGVISGFTVNSYTQLPNKFNPGSNPWEINFKITVGGNVSNQGVLASMGSYNFAFYIGDSKFHIVASNNGTSWSVNGTGTYTVLTNTSYFIRIKFTGSQYTTEYSLDGNTYTQDISVSSSINIGSCYLTFGVGRTSDTPAFLGSIDLNESYINIGGHRWWTGRTTPMFCSEEEWQGSVGLYGVCGKFVYNETDGTLKLPKVTGFIEGTIDNNALGDLVEAGLPNILGNISYINSYTSIPDSDINKAGTALFWTRKTTDKPTVIGTQGVGAAVITLDASRFNSIHGNSSTVQPQSIKGFLYIVLANSTKTPVQVDIDNIVTDLGNKADANLANLTSDGQKAMANAAMPSGQYIDYAVKTAQNVIQNLPEAPADGYWQIFVFSQNNAEGTVLRILDTTGSAIYSSYSANSLDSALSCFVPVNKGVVYSLFFYNNNYNTAQPTMSLLRFVYANGSAPA